MELFKEKISLIAVLTFSSMTNKILVSKYADTFLLSIQKTLVNNTKLSLSIFFILKTNSMA